MKSGYTWKWSVQFVFFHIWCSSVPYVCSANCDSSVLATDVHESNTTIRLVWFFSLMRLLSPGMENRLDSTTFFLQRCLVYSPSNISRMRPVQLPVMQASCRSSFALTCCLSVNACGLNGCITNASSHSPELSNPFSVKESLLIPAFLFFLTSDSFVTLDELYNPRFISMQVRLYKETTSIQLFWSLSA